MDTVTLINEFEAHTMDQMESKKLILAQLKEYGHKVYSREMLQGHMTASAIVLDSQLDKILMVFHHIYNSYTWPGGHADGNEDLYEVAYKEVVEETGATKIRPVSKKILSVEQLLVKEHIKNGKKISEHYHYNVTFGFICSEKETLKINSDENSSVEWLEIQNLSQYCKEETMLPIYHENINKIKDIMAEKKQNYQFLPQLLLEWYEKNARDLPWRKSADAYHIWLSEIMLQQTRVDTVIDYYYRFLDSFPTVNALAEAYEEKVLKLWEGLGYYSRARNLHKAAKIIVEQYGGVFPKNRSEIMKLPGIGSYTAGAISSIAFNLPVAAVDGNVLRVISRVTENYQCIDEEKVKREVEENLKMVYPKNRCGDFTQSLMELGATICVPNGKPLCQQCPLLNICMAYKNNVYQLLPVRKEKTPRKVLEFTVFVFINQGKIALQKRQGKGVLEGMWELPNKEGFMKMKEALLYVERETCSHFVVEKIKKAHHIFTHIQWNMICYYISCEAPFGNYIWADSEALEKEYSVPTAFKKFLSFKELPHYK